MTRYERLWFRPVTVKDAIKWCVTVHRHLRRELVSAKFAVAVVDRTGTRRGVGLVTSGPRVWEGTGRCNIARIGTDGVKNGCSMLYGALCRAATALGYREAWTYSGRRTRPPEPTKPTAAPCRTALCQMSMAANSRNIGRLGVNRMKTLARHIHAYECAYEVDCKVDAAGFAVARAAAKALNVISIEAQCDGKPVDYAEIAEQCAHLLCLISSYNTLVRVRAELGEE